MIRQRGLNALSGEAQLAWVCSILAAVLAAGIAAIGWSLASASARAVSPTWREVVWTLEFAAAAWMPLALAADLVPMCRLMQKRLAPRAELLRQIREGGRLLLVGFASLGALSVVVELAFRTEAESIAARLAVGPVFVAIPFGLGLGAGAIWHGLVRPAWLLLLALASASVVALGLGGWHAALLAAGPVLLLSVGLLFWGGWQRFEAALAAPLRIEGAAQPDRASLIDLFHRQVRTPLQRWKAVDPGLVRVLTGPLASVAFNAKAALMLLVVHDGVTGADGLRFAVWTLFALLSLMAPDTHWRYLLAPGGSRRPARGRLMVAGTLACFAFMGLVVFAPLEFVYQHWRTGLSLADAIHFVAPLIPATAAEMALAIALAAWLRGVCPDFVGAAVVLVSFTLFAVFLSLLGQPGLSDWWDAALWQRDTWHFTGVLALTVLLTWLADRAWATKDLALKKKTR